MIDSSVAASWCIPDENSAVAARALAAAASEGFSVPSIFWHELRNVFLVNERRGRLTVGETRRGLALVGDMSPIVDDAVFDHALLDIARRHRLTAYDAVYLELALRAGLPLATLDHRLAEAAAAEGVEIVA